MTDQAEKKQQWSAEDILEFLCQHRAELRALGVQKIGLFGSYVRGEQTAKSDMDFLVEMENWTWKQWSQVWNFLEDHLGVKVDLIPEKDLRPELHDYVFPEVRYAEGF